MFIVNVKWNPTRTKNPSELDEGGWTLIRELSADDEHSMQSVGTAAFPPQACRIWRLQQFASRQFFERHDKLKLRVPNRQHGTRSFAYDSFRDAAEHDVGESRSAVRSHDNEVDLVVLCVT